MRCHNIGLIEGVPKIFFRNNFVLRTLTLNLTLRRPFSQIYNPQNGEPTSHFKQKLRDDVNRISYEGIGRTDKVFIVLSAIKNRSRSTICERSCDRGLRTFQGRGVTPKLANSVVNREFFAQIKRIIQRPTFYTELLARVKSGNDITVVNNA